jgi:hypothetical protein
MKMSNEQVASELMGLPPEQREFWACVLLGGGGSRNGANGLEHGPERLPAASPSTLQDILAEAGSNPALVPRLEAELLKLPAQVRRRIAGLLLESLGPDAAYLREVEDEAHRRRLEMETGAVEGIDWGVARAMLRARFGP